MRFSYEVNLGNLIALAVMLLTFWRLHQANVKRFHSIEFKVGLMWKSFAHKFHLPENLIEDDNGG